MKKFLVATILMLAILCSQAFAVDEIPQNPTVEYKVASADIVFIIDASGSMQDDIDSVRDNVKAFASALTKKNIDVRFAVVDFRDNYNQDRRIAHIVRIHEFNGSHWTTSSQGVFEALDSITADGDETITHALRQILDWDDFRPEAFHFGFLLTDEPTVRSRYITDPDYMTLNQVVPLLKNLPIQMSVITTMSLKDHYRSLFSDTDGVYIDIDREDYYKSMLDIAQWIIEIITYPSGLYHTTIEIVPHNITENSSIMDNIAAGADITRDQINVLTEDNYNYYDVSLPHEPSDDMRAKVDGEFITKIDTINLYSDKLSKDQYGYYMFQLDINISADIIGNGLRIGNSTTFGDARDGYIDFIMFNEDGTKIDTITQNTNRVLVLMYGKTESCLTLYLVKSNSDGAVRLWSEDAENFGEYITENRTSVLDSVKKGLRNAVDSIRNLFGGGDDDGGSSGGCDSGIGIVAMIALAGMFYKKH